MPSFLTKEEIESVYYNNFVELISTSDRSTMSRILEVMGRSTKSIRLRNSAKKLHSNLFGSVSPFYAEENGQYYTKPKIAKMCIANIRVAEYDLIIEPSAGHGDFYNLLPSEKTIAFDIDPKCAGVTQGNYFDYSLEREKCGKVVVVGNPPFGKNSKMAVDFFEHAATHADLIAFILPRTFRKTTITNRLPMNFSLRKEFILPENSFYVEDLEGNKEDYDVPCVFQVWERSTSLRQKISEPLEHNDFTFAPRETADFAIRRVGAYAGKVFTDIDTDKRGLRSSSHYFIKTACTDSIRVFQDMWQKEFSPSADPNCVGFKYDTSGNPSISKAELVRAYEKHKRNLNLSRI